MTRIISGLIGGIAVLAFCLPVMASSGDGARSSGADMVQAKKCKSGYVYNPDTKKCHPRGSH